MLRRGQRTPAFDHERTPRGFGLGVHNSVVYFVLAEAALRVKIGTSQDIEKRFRGLEATSPVSLTLLGAVHGRRAVEQWCHRHCERDQSHFEWFHWTPRVVEFIDLVIAHGANAASTLCPAEARSDGLTAQRRRRGSASMATLTATATPIGALCQCERCLAYVEKGGGHARRK